MSEIAIRIDNLGKAYRTGAREQRPDTLGGVLAGWLRSPFHNFRKIRDLRRISENSTESDVFWALKHLNLEVKRGEVLGIIGRNGAGKSTLLKVLSHITPPTTGAIDIYGRVASLLEVGTGFNPELTGRENIFLNGAILGMTRREIARKFDEIVAFSGVERFIDTPAKRYSSGMKVRLAFAVAAHLEPEILVIDEVLAVGDAEFQKKCLGKMQDVSRNEGRTVLFVSHDMSAVQNLCTRAVCLDEGRLCFDGGVSQCIDYYLNTGKSADAFRHFDQHPRKGDGALQIRSAGFRDRSGNDTASVAAGEELNLVIQFSKNLQAEEFGRLSLYVEFRDFLMHPVFSASTRFSAKFEATEAFDKVCCKIPSMNLGEGVYSVDFWLAYNSGLSDELRHALEIEILNSDFYHTGHMPVPRKHGAALIPHEWHPVYE